MRVLKISLLVLLLFFISQSCDTVETIDKEEPKIDISYAGAYPMVCDTLYFGESFVIKALFTDNTELGSYSLDIHNNFNHHSHSTEVAECELDPVKSPVNPYSFVEEYDIPENLDNYETNLLFTLPSGNDSGAYDEGDYHFMIRLSDKEGWSTLVGIGIKILHR